MTAILGAGISGLSAAYYALQNSKVTPIVILEASNRVGGWLRSIKQPDGTIFEQGPRSIRAKNGENSALELMEQLGLSDKVIPIKFNHPAAQNRLIYSDNQLHFLPNSWKSLMKNTLLNRSFLSIMWNDFKAPKGSEDDESAYSFIERRFGQDVADKIISSMVCGIYAGDAHKISIKSLIKIFFETEQKHGSVIKGLIIEYLKMVNEKKKKLKSISTDGNQINVESQNTLLNILQKCEAEKWSTWGVQGGIEQLPLALASNITKRGVIIKTEHNCEKLKFNKDHIELIVNGEIKRYSHIISSLPAKNLADLMEEQHSELSTELRGIPTVTVGVVNLQFSENILPINAFGVLIPPKEGLPILGIMFDSCIFPQNSKTTVRINTNFYYLFFLVSFHISYHTLCFNLLFPILDIILKLHKMFLNIYVYAHKYIMD